MAYNQNGLQAAGTYANDGVSGGGGGGAGRIRINSLAADDLTIDAAAMVSPSDVVDGCQGACSRGDLAVW